MGNLGRRTTSAVLTLGILFVPILVGGPAAFANNYSEDDAWQFETSADMANEAAEQDLIQQKQNHMFQPPVTNYTTTNATTIGNQTNCTVTSTAVGNSGTDSEGGNSSDASGAQAASVGNTGTSTISGDGATGVPGELLNSQVNPGTVISTSANNPTVSSASGSLTEALNSAQANEAMQTSTQTGDTACLTNRGSGISGTVGSSNGGTLN